MTENTYKKYCLVIDEWFCNGFNGTKRFVSPRHDNYYVYVLINPIDNKPFYIGKGKKSRAKNHTKEVINNQIVNHKKHIVIQDIIKNNLEPKIAIIENNLTENDALTLEKILIDVNKHRITNIQSGRLGKNDKAALWAKIELGRLKTLEKLISENRPKSHIDIYKRNVELLTRLSKKEVLWH